MKFCQVGNRQAIVIIQKRAFYDAISIAEHWSSLQFVLFVHECVCCYFLARVLAFHLNLFADKMISCLHIGPHTFDIKWVCKYVDTIHLPNTMLMSRAALESPNILIFLSVGGPRLNRIDFKALKIISPIALCYLFFTNQRLKWNE